MKPAVTLACGGVLAVLLALEVSADIPTDAAPPAASAPGPVKAGAPPRALPDETPRWTATALARPLFSPDRRPPHAPAEGNAAAADSRPTLPRLAGIIVDPRRSVAIFAPATSGGKPLAVAEGERLLRDWTVVHIDPRAVQVRGPDGDSTLHVGFDLTADARASAPPPPGLPLMPSLRGRPFGLHPFQQRQGADE